MRLLMLVGVPFCLLQVVMIEPAFRLAQLLPKWNDAILPCQILTIGLMVNAPAGRRRVCSMHKVGFECS